MASIQFTEADRDDRGFVKAPAQGPRSLADLLPPIGTPATPAQQRPASKAEQALLLMVALIVIGIAIYRFGFSGDAPAPPASVPVATQTGGGAVLTPSPIPAVLRQAYSAPDVPLGQIEATRAITPVAHFGMDWIAYRDGNGLVWLRASDWPQLPIIGPDLAPPPTPAYVAPAATPPPPPPPCAQAGVPGKMVEVCDYAELSVLEARAKEQWLSTYGGNIGVISTPSPQIMRTP